MRGKKGYKSTGLLPLFELSSSILSPNLEQHYTSKSQPKYLYPTFKMKSFALILLALTAIVAAVPNPAENAEALELHVS